MRFHVTVTETVSTAFYVEAKNKEDLENWLEEHGADAVSFLTGRQVVCERDYGYERSYKEDSGGELPDYDTELEPQNPDGVHSQMDMRAHYYEKKKGRKKK